ncbi:unnamed protein product [Penicillium salamii]|uniref:Uncharacterized protein n=1 Tax=Penicillium salamii TaxID=1612424 RepID=A0A9W4N4G8_9EURO|nr:unnamed protein product [Penicillium salamii]
MATGITPLGSVLGRSLTPLPTAEKPLSKSAQSVVTYLCLNCVGHWPKFWWEVQLRLDDYTEVLYMLNLDKSLCDYVEDKVRYDYDSRCYCLTIRMPSPVHDTFSLYPGVIVEICYSQKSKRISHLVNDYILNTDGSVNVVIALDIDYKGSKRATMIVWRPEYTTIDGVEEFRPFRIDSGLPTKETMLRLSLRDFAIEELLRGNIGLDREIIITSKQLCDYLSGVEARQ